MQSNSRPNPRTKRFGLFLGLPVCLLLIVSMSAAGQAADASNRTLFGSQAVQRELRLSLEQRAKIAVILKEMEDEIARKVKEAGPKAKEEEIADPIIAKQGPRLQEILDPAQAVRIWQIGVQASGPAMFHNNRVQRILKLSPDQTVSLAELSDKMVAEVTQLATDPKLDIKAIQERAELARRTCFVSSVAVLTGQQKSALRELIGKPFDLETLQPGYALPRPLTFVFGINGQNGFLLLNSKEVQRDLKLSDSQLSELRALLKQLDESLTEVRLSVLRSADKDFPDMTPDEQRRIVQSILESANKIHRERGVEVLGLLTPQQIEKLDKHIVQVLGARGIEVESIAKRLRLTAEQKAAAVKLTAEFDNTTAPLRVVVNQTDFDSIVFDKQLTTLEAALRKLLTPDQVKTLVEMAR